MGFADDICYRVAHRLVEKRDAPMFRRPGTAGNSTDALEESGSIAGSVDLGEKSNWYSWRARELKQQFLDHFDPEVVRGKEVLDFGCGGGFLSLLLSELGAKSVCGTDIRRDHIQQATALVEAQEPENPPEFVLSQSMDRIDFPDDSFDVIVCFDVLEHIMSYRTIIPEWKRILRPGGRILVWWQPHYHPYGHHLQTYIPIPWARVMFSKKTLGKTCGRILESPEYYPRFWDLDEDGNKLPSREFSGEGGVNGLTIANFEKLYRSAGLRPVREQPYPFRGNSLVSGVSGTLSRLPGLKEFFTAYMIYEIAK